MRHHFRRTTALIVAGLVVLFALAPRLDSIGEGACGLARSALAKELGASLRVERCELAPFLAGVELWGLSLQSSGEEGGAGAYRVAAERLLVRLRLLPLAWGELHVERVEIENPVLTASLAPPKDTAEPGELPAKGDEERCVVEQLERLEIESVQLTGGRVDLELEEGKSLVLEGIGLEVSRRGPSRAVRLSTSDGFVKVGNLSVPISRLSASAELDRGGLRPLAIDLSVGDLMLAARGSLRQPCNPVVSLDAEAKLPLDLLGKAFPALPEPLSGFVGAALRVEGPLASPSIQGWLDLSQIAVLTFAPGELFVDLKLSDRRLIIDRLDVPFMNGGLVRAKGALSLRGDLPLVLEAELERVSFGQILHKMGLEHSWVDFAGSGAVSVAGTLNPFHLAGPASVTVRDFRLYGRGFDQAPTHALLQFDAFDVELQTDFDGRRVHLGPALLRSARSRLRADATLYLTTREGLSIEAAFDKLELSDLGHLLGIPWEGSLTGTGTLRGPYSAPEIAGNASIEQFRFHKLKAGKASTQIGFRDGRISLDTVAAQQGATKLAGSALFDFNGSRPEVRARASMESGRLAELAEMVGDEHWSLALLRGRADGRVRGGGTVEGALDEPISTIELALSDVTIWERRFGTGAFRFRSLPGHVLSIDELSLEGPAGAVRMGGTIALDGELTLAVEVPRLTVSELALPDAPQLGARGEVSAMLSISGAGGKTETTGAVEVKGLEFFGVALGDGSLSLEGEDAALALRGELGNALYLDADLAVEGAQPFHVELKAKTERLGDYLALLPGLPASRGALTGTLEVEGDLAEWHRSRGALKLTRLNLELDGYRLRNDEPIEVAFQGAAVQFSALTLRGPTGNNVSLSGGWNSAKLMELAIDGVVDARLIGAFTDFVDQVGGELSLSASLVGRFENPTLVGRANLEEVRFQLARMPFPTSVRELHGAVEFSKERAWLDGVTAEVNGGAAQLRGEVAMSDLIPRELNLSMSFEHVAARLAEGFSGLGSGELQLTGQPEAMSLTGDLKLSDVRYTRELDPDSLMRELSRGGESVSASDGRERLHYDIALHLAEPARIDNNFLKLQVGGDLRLIGSNLRLGLAGTLSAPGEGTAYFRGNELLVTRAVLELTEKSRAWGELEASAEGQVRDYRVLVHLHGPLDSLQLDLTSEPSLSRVDIVTLMTLGMTSRDGGLGASSTAMGAGLVGETLFNISGLNRQVKQFVPKSELFKQLSFSLSTQYSEVSGQVEPTAQFESRILSDSLKVRLSQPVLTGRGRRAQMEYKINDRASAQAQWESENSDYRSFGDLGLDLKLRWDF